MHRMRRVLVFLLAALVLSACRIDSTVTLKVQPDGSGVITLAVVADAAVVKAAPGLAADLRLDDAAAAGWTVDGPKPTDGGGLQVTLTHPFTTVQEATALLQSINGSGGPLHPTGAGPVGSDGQLRHVRKRGLSCPPATPTRH